MENPKLKRWLKKQSNQALKQFFLSAISELSITDQEELIRLITEASDDNPSPLITSGTVKAKFSDQLIPTVVELDRRELFGVLDKNTILEADGLVLNKTCLKDIFRVGRILLLVTMPYSNETTDLIVKNNTLTIKG